MNNKIIALIAAAIILIAGVGVILSQNHDDAKGWYVWDPTVENVEYTKLTATPQIMNVIEDMYEAVYGKLPSYDNKVSEDDMVSYDSLVTKTSSGISIKNVVNKEKPILFTSEELSKLKIISYSSGVTDTYAKIFGDDLWNTVVAAGNSTWNNYPDNEMKNWSDTDSGTLGSEYTLSVENLLNYLKYAGAKTSGDTYCVVAWSYIKNYSAVIDALKSAGYNNVKVVCIDYNAITGAEDFGYLLSVCDMLGQLVNVEPEENDSLIDFQKKLYAIDKSLKDVKENATVYLENASGKSPGKNTIVQLCFDVLKLDNINTESGTVALSDEIIVSQKPKVIFFTDEDTRTMDQKMRVTTI